MQKGDSLKKQPENRALIASPVIHGRKARASRSRIPILGKFKFFARQPDTGSLNQPLFNPSRYTQPSDGIHSQNSTRIHKVSFSGSQRH